VSSHLDELWDVAWDGWGRHLGIGDASTLYERDEPLRQRAPLGFVWPENWEGRDRMTNVREDLHA
jgi:hypothetical protein